MNVGDIMSTQGDVPYTEVFTQKFNGFINSLPQVHHVIPHCTHGIPQCTAQNICRVFTFCFHFLASENELEELLTI